MKKKIWFHADDYGVTLGQSERILSCYTNGRLNSISIIPNSHNLKESLEILKKTDSNNKIRRVLHMNFVEGRPLSGAENVPLLVDKEGFFDKSFIDIFKWNFIKKGESRLELIKQLKLEIRSQLRAVSRQHDFEITAIDSHQHYHMIPVIFDAMLEVLAESEFEDLSIEHVRISVDPVAPLMHAKGMLRRVRIINFVKWFILFIYAKRNKKILEAKGIKVPVFFGIFFTCEMKKEVVERLLPMYIKYADKKDAELELMFHPGNLKNVHELLDMRKDELADFYMSDNRYEEAECLRSIRVK